jgi:hypothetical protein
MQLRAIADVAPVVTMATEAISEIINISKGPTNCGHHFCEVSLQKDQPSLRKMKLKNCALFGCYHGNSSHFGFFKHWIPTGLWLLLFL